MSFIIKLINVFDLYTERKIFLKLNELLGKNIKQVIDVGAHKGEFILRLSKLFNIRNALSFEPNPKVFNILNNNTSDLQKKKILKTLNLGIGEDNKTEILNVNIESSSSSINKLNKESNYFIRKYRVLNFFKNKNITKPVQIRITKLSDILKKYQLKEIDLLKIDTEGYELSVLKSVINNLKDIKVIYFEHHFDDMIIKKYKLGDIHSLLIENDFKKYFKIKMSFRKSFEYIYYNKNLLKN
tara:strand:- start:3 stop:725 length:723 start_codon:yes stop_codon:yes gene_type:complete